MSSQVPVPDRSAEGQRSLEHTTDAYIEAWGPTLARAFAQAAEGVYKPMLNLETINQIVENSVEADGHDKKELLYNWLEQLLLEFDIKEMVYGSYDISIKFKAPALFKLLAKMKGEKYYKGKNGPQK